MALANRPYQLEVSGFTHISSWQGWLCEVFFIDVYAWRSVNGSAASCVRRARLPGAGAVRTSARARQEPDG